RFRKFAHRETAIMLSNTHSPWSWHSLITSPPFWSFAAFIAGLLAGCLIQTSDKNVGAPPQKAGSDLSFHESGSEADPRVAAALYCWQAKAHIARSLVAREWTLREAAEAFRVLDEANPNFNRRLFRSTYPGETDEESHCREVINWLTNYYSRRDADLPGRDLFEVIKDLEAQ